MYPLLIMTGNPYINQFKLKGNELKEAVGTFEPFSGHLVAFLKLFSERTSGAHTAVQMNMKGGSDFLLCHLGS